MKADSNLKKAVNMVNMVNLLGLLENVLHEGAQNGERKQIKSLAPRKQFTKFTSSQGFLRFESGQKRGVRGVGQADFAIFAAIGAATVSYTGVHLEHLLTLMIVRRVFDRAVIKARGHGRIAGEPACELALKSVNFHF